MANLPAFFMGFLAASFQVYLLREFSVHFYGNELTYGLVLAFWFLWGGAGSLMAPRRTAQPGNVERIYYGIILLFPASLAALRLSRFVFGVPPGELTGLAPALITALVVTFLTSFPLGALFVWNANLPGAGVARVYAYESLGAACAGLIVHLCLVPLIPNWAGNALIGGSVAVGVFLTFGRRRRKGSVAALLAALALFAMADGPVQVAWWGKLPLLGSRDTPYGRLQVIGAGGQVSLFANGSPVFTCPDRAAAENSIHFAMLQNPSAGNVLLLGGGAGGGLSEILKYNRVRADYVEPDPGIIRTAEGFLPETERRALRNPRVRVLFEDGRRFLRTTESVYDAVILNLPEPSTAQINRFYTLEFFRTARSRLAPGGVLSLTVSSSENYVGPDLGGFLASMYRTLKAVFPEVAVVPGNTNVFLASSSPLTLDPEALEERIRRFGIDLVSINPTSLESRLNPLGLGRLAEIIMNSPAPINRDMFPIGYYFQSVLWSSQFRGFEAGLLRGLSRAGGTRLLGFLILIYALILAAVFARGPGFTGRWIVPVWAMGFATIVVEMCLIVAFQASFGNLYGKIALLTAFFMAGMFVGSRPGARKRGSGRAPILAVQGGFILVLGAIRILLGTRAPELLFYLSLFALGGLGGRLFTVTNGLLPGDRAHSGLAYGADLLGSFAGALTAAAVFIPLAGIPPLLDAMMGMNALGLIFIFALFLQNRKA